MGLELPQTEYVYFNKFNGEFEKFSTSNSVQIDKKIYSILKEIDSNANEILQNKNEQIKEENLKQILRLLHNIMFTKFNEEH